MTPPKDPLIAIIGATGTGKSKLAIDLALRFNGEIINGDAMQMYKGLPIITNKTTPDEAQGIPHHLFDFIGLQERPWNVSTFTRECLRVLKDVRGRGKLPILVGGTHYYTQAALLRDSLVNAAAGEGGRKGEEVDEGVAGGKEQESKEEKERKWPILAASGDEIFAKLKEVDPVMARRWHPKDTRKVRRSLEIWLETGRPASEIYEEQKIASRKDDDKSEGSVDENSESSLRYPTLVFWIRSQNDVLRDRLDKRVDQMVKHGLVTEVEEMVDLAAEAEKNGVVVDRTSGIWASIGFKEVEPYVLAKRSGRDLTPAQDTKLKENAIELTQIATRQYANRQERWIKYKFMDAMDDAREANRVYPVDSTDVDRWEEDVRSTSQAIATAFLDGTSLPNPQSVSTMASDLLHLIAEERRTRSEKRIPEAHECTLCNKFLMTKGQWEDHLKSNRHKKVLQAAAKRANRPG